MTEVSGSSRPAAEIASPGPRENQLERAESVDDRASRMRLRRRLLLWSLPVVLVLSLVAVKLLSTVALGSEARQAYLAGNVTGAQQAAGLLGRLNVIEPYKAPFARGDAQVLAGDLDGARAAFEEALEKAPAGSDESCQVRVNLVLSLEKLSESAVAAGRSSQANGYDQRVLQVVAGAPADCFNGTGQSDTGGELRDAQQRAQQRQQGRSDSQQQGQQGDQGQQPQPSQDKQDQLDSKTQDNLQQRNQGNQPGTSSRPPVDKPW